MLRGSVIVFTAVFAKFLLHRHIKCIQWFGIVIVIGGLLTVGITGWLLVSKMVFFASLFLQE